MKQKNTLRLFCIPYAGGSVSIYRNWPNCLPKAIEVCPIELPGRGNRSKENLFNNLLSLVKTLAKDILHSLDKPFAFFGHSMGALISFELARFLRRKNNLSPIHIFVSGRCAPQIPRSKPPINQLPEAEFVEELCRLNGMPGSVLQNSELMELMLPVIRADFAICETYSYSVEEPLECSISAFGGLQDNEVNREEIVAWSQQTRKGFTYRMFPGDHFFLKSNEELLLRAIAQDITPHLNNIIKNNSNNYSV